jgi:hypothetical protein
MVLNASLILDFLVVVIPVQWLATYIFTVCCRSLSTLHPIVYWNLVLMARLLISRTQTCIEAYTKKSLPCAFLQFLLINTNNFFQTGILYYGKILCSWPNNFLRDIKLKRTCDSFVYEEHCKEI